jgi:hypothetical protein
MGRPRAASSVSEFAAALASLVTARSSYRYDWVARKGQYSIFSFFSRVVPKVRVTLKPHGNGKRTESETTGSSIRTTS